MSAATEETLKELLQVSRTSSGHIKLMAEKMGVTLSDLGNSASGSSSMLKKLGNAVGVTVGAFADIIGEINDFGRTAASSGVTVSTTFERFAGYVKNIEPLNKAFTAISVLSSEFENNKKIYNDLARNGATFGGSLAEVAVVAGRAYMTMDQFAVVAKNSTDVFRLLGPTTESGMNKFVSIQNSLLDKDSPYARNIIALTGNAEGAAEALTGYMRSQASMNKQQFMSTERIIQGTIEYAREMDTLSKITGKRKEQIQKEYDEVAAEESFQQYLSTLDADKADAARAAINTARQTFGKDVADQLRTAIQTGISTPLTEGQQNMYLMTGGATQAFVEQTMKNVSEGKKAEDIQRDVVASAREAYKFYSEFSNDNNVVLGINAAFKTGLQSATAGVLGAIGRYRTEEEALAKIKEEQEKQRAGSATGLTLAENALTEVGAKINELRKNVLDPIINQVSTITKSVSDVVSTVFGSQMAKDVTNFVGSAITDIGNAVTSGELKKALEEQLVISNPILSAAYSVGKATYSVGKAATDMVEKLENVVGPHIAAAILMFTSAISEFSEIIPGRTTLENKIQDKEKEIAETKINLSKTSKETEPLKYQELIDNLAKSQKELDRLQKDKELRGMDYSEIVEKIKRDSARQVLPETRSESPPSIPTGTNTGETGENQPPSSAVSSATTANSPGTNAGSTPVSQVSPEQVTQLITSNKELGEILNNKLTELINVARASNDNSSKTITAINRLNNDGFAYATG